MNRQFISNKLYNGCYRIKLWLLCKYYYVRNRMRLNSTGVIYEKDFIANGKLIISNCESMIIGNNVGMSNVFIFAIDKIEYRRRCDDRSRNYDYR